MSTRKFAVVTDNIVDFIFEVSENATYSGIREITGLDEVSVGYVFDAETQSFSPKPE